MEFNQVRTQFFWKFFNNSSKCPKVANDMSMKTREWDLHNAR